MGIQLRNAKYFAGNCRGKNAKGIFKGPKRCLCAYQGICFRQWFASTATAGYAWVSYAWCYKCSFPIGKHDCPMYLALIVGCLLEKYISLSLSLSCLMWFSCCFKPVTLMSKVWMSRWLMRGGRIFGLWLHISLISFHSMPGGRIIYRSCQGRWL